MLLIIKGHDNGPPSNAKCSSNTHYCQHDLPRWSFSFGKLAKGETVTILKPTASSASHIKNIC